MPDIYKYDESNIEFANFSPGSLLEDCEFKNVNFAQLVLKSVSFLNCKFINCNLANQSLLNTSLREISFESCNLLGINWCVVKRFETVRFIDSKLNFSSFQGLKLKQTDIINCSAVEVDFSGSDLSSSDFSGTDFSGTNFENAVLIDTDFRTSRNYLFDIRTAKIKGAKFRFPDVISLLTALGIEVDF